MLLDHLARESKAFLFGNVCKAALQCKNSLSMKPGIVKNICIHSKHFSLSQLMFSCAKLCDIGCEQFLKITAK